MADFNARTPDCDDGEGERGRRGPRGHDGHDGPAGPTGPTGPAGTGDGFQRPGLIAAARVAADGTFITNRGFATVTSPSAGVYELTLNAGTPDDNIISNVTVNRTSSSNPAIAPIASATAGVILVILAQGGVGFASDFYITVVDNSAF